MSKENPFEHSPVNDEALYRHLDHLEAEGRRDIESIEPPVKFLKIPEAVEASRQGKLRVLRGLSDKEKDIA